MAMQDAMLADIAPARRLVEIKRANLQCDSMRQTMAKEIVPELSLKGTSSGVHTAE